MKMITSKKSAFTAIRLGVIALIIAGAFSSCYVSHPYGAHWVPGHWAPGYYHAHWVPGHWA
ncbi:MAG TPA: hypothetical protein VGR89_04670 [Puia sp.]|nr:hypothetical protein [Puia sp.]